MRRRGGDPVKERRLRRHLTVPAAATPNALLHDVLHDEPFARFAVRADRRRGERPRQHERDQHGEERDIANVRAYVAHRFAAARNTRRS